MGSMTTGRTSKKRHYIQVEYILCPQRKDNISMKHIICTRDEAKKCCTKMSERRKPHHNIGSYQCMPPHRNGRKLSVRGDIQNWNISDNVILIIFCYVFTYEHHYTYVSGHFSAEKRCGAYTRSASCKLDSAHNRETRLPLQIHWSENHFSPRADSG